MWTSAGKGVAYVLATRGEAGIDHLEPERCAVVREAEQRAAAAIVGVEVVEFLDHHDGAIEHALPLRRDIASAIRRHRPELVVTLNHHDDWPGGGGWNTPDHRHLGRGVLDAVSDAGNRWIHPDAGPPWNGVRWVAIAGSPHPSHAVDVTDGLDRAVASLEAHAEYLRSLGGAMGDARSFLEGQARAAGGRFGGGLATAFEVIEFG